MINFDELKAKAIDAMTVIADKAGDVYAKAEEKTKELAKTTQLNAEIAREKSNAKKLTMELGAMYYQLFKDAPDESLAQLCAEITASNDNIAALQKMIDEVKAAGNAEDDDVEVEIVTEDDCGCVIDEDEKAAACDCGCEETAEAEEPAAEETCSCCGEDETEAAPEEEPKADDCGCGCEDNEE